MRNLTLIKLTAVFLTIAASVLLSYSLRANSDEMCPPGMIYDEETQMCYIGGADITCRCNKDITLNLMAAGLMLEEMYVEGVKILSVGLCTGIVINK